MVGVQDESLTGIKTFILFGDTEITDLETLLDTYLHFFIFIYYYYHYHCYHIIYVLLYYFELIINKYNPPQYFGDRHASLSWGIAGSGTGIIILIIIIIND